jgi:hypothetical protein
MPPAASRPPAAPHRGKASKPRVVRPASPAAARRLDEGHAQAERGEMLSGDESMAFVLGLITAPITK